MATFVTNSMSTSSLPDFSMPALNRHGNLIYVDSNNGEEKVKRRGLDVKRMIDEIGEGLLVSEYPGSRFVAPQQFYMKMNYLYPGSYDLEFKATDNRVEADVNFWGEFNWNLSDNSMNSDKNVQGKFNQLDWYNDISNKGQAIGGFQVFGLKPTSVTKYTDKTTKGGRYRLLTKGDNVFWGSEFGKNRIEGGNGDDWVTCYKSDTIITGSGEDTIYWDNYLMGFDKLPDQGLPTKVPLIKDFDSASDKIQINSNLKTISVDLKTGAGDGNSGTKNKQTCKADFKELFLEKSGDGSYLLGRYQWDNGCKDLGEYYVAFADLPNVKEDSLLNYSFVSSPQRPYSTN